MVKPDGLQRCLVGEIIARFEAKGFQLLALRQMSASRELLENHYANLRAKSFFGSLIDYMLSSPVVAMVWLGDGVVAEGRKMLGATKPVESAMGTIRGDFCIDIGRNVCHGSDSVKSAESEIALWFSEGSNEWSHHSARWICEVAPTTLQKPASGTGDSSVKLGKKRTKKQRRKERKRAEAAAASTAPADIAATTIQSASHNVARNIMGKDGTGKAALQQGTSPVFANEADMVAHLARMGMPAAMLHKLTQEQKKKMFAMTQNPSIMKRATAAVESQGASPPQLAMARAEQKVKQPFSWSDEKAQAHVHIPCNASTKVTDIQCAFHADSIDLCVGDRRIFSGSLFQRIRPTACSWKLESGDSHSADSKLATKQLNLLLVKETPMRWLQVLRAG